MSTTTGVYVGTAATSEPRDVQPTHDLASAPQPTDRTLRMRRSLPVLAFRFVAFSVRVVRMVPKRPR